MQLLNEDDNNDFDGEKQSYDRLMDGKDIRYKTEVNSDQRSIIPLIETSIEHFSKKGINLSVAKRFVLSFIDMGASLDRKSRSEVVKALSEKSNFIEKQALMEKQNNIIK